MKSFNQRMSQHQERKIAGDLGGRVQKASGATDFAKGDVRESEWLHECKATSGSSYRLDRNTILKIRSHTLQGSLADWSIQVQFRGPLGQNMDVAVIDYSTFCAMKSLWDEHQRQQRVMNCPHRGGGNGMTPCPTCGGTH